MPGLPEDGSEVEAVTLPSLEYDRGAEPVTGTLHTRPSPFGPPPNCYVGGVGVDPATVRPAGGTDRHKKDAQGHEHKPAGEGGGQFTSGPVAGTTTGGAPTKASNDQSIGERIAAFRKAVDAWTDVAGVRQLKAAQAKLAGLTKKMYLKLEGRYGRRQAIAIMGAGQVLAWGAFLGGAAAGVPIWLPGSSLWGSLPAIALAEGYLQAKKLLSKGVDVDKHAAESEGDDPAGAVRELLAAVYAEAGQPAPQVTEEQIKAALAGQEAGE